MSSPTTTSQVDLLVIGGGPAGLAAALMFSRLRRSTLVYDSGVYRNGMSPIAHTILGNEPVEPETYRREARAQIELGYKWTKFIDGKITRLTKGDQGFEAEDGNGNKVLARRVILATGVRDILAPIPGLQEAWGKRAIHCIFCHGTETRDQSLGFLLTRPSARFNPMIVAGAFKLWNTLNQPKVYFFTHGMDVDKPEDLKDSGLEKFMGIIKANPEKYEIVCDEVTAIESTPSELILFFPSRAQIAVPYIAVFPQKVTASSDAQPILTKDLLLADLSMFGDIAPPSPALEAAGAPRMGDDPRTNVPGLYWAGNAGSWMANVNLAVAQGQQAGAFAGDSLGEEELKAMLAQAA